MTKAHHSDDEGNTEQVSIPGWKLSRVLTITCAISVLTIGRMATQATVERWESENVPDNLRADRWEATATGLATRRKAEIACGPLPPQAWIDRKHVTAPVELLGEWPEELRKCVADTILE